ncbi:hypothetical protein GGR53DRAFT_490440 [Hypoxylon sp. FL1150]|nr:hypothetical protein GGR53DRAFT_490440 [Hypoxylon sp. FL1150]
MSQRPSPRRLSYPTTHRSLVRFRIHTLNHLRRTTMANSKSIPRERQVVLQQLYDDLTVWLNFDDETKHFVQGFLDSKFVKPFFQEYRRDYLEAAAEIEDVGCGALQQWCQSTNAFDLPVYYRSAAPDKRGWTTLDHAGRFLVRILHYSWDNEGEWDHGKYEPEAGESEIEFFQAWRVLVYLQAEWEAANLDEWDVSHLSPRFGRMGS